MTNDLQPVLLPLAGGVGTDRSFDAIAIGASAGGVHALGVLLPALPARLRVAVFVVLHLPPAHASPLASIFGPRCAFAVREAEDKEPVVAQTIYFAPPDYHLLVEAGANAGPNDIAHLALSADPPVHFSRPSIDVLFASAADVYGERLLGIVLTGANQDGAAGLQAVRRAGGMTVVQDPATAQSAQMPEAALALGAPDRVLSLAQMADLLRRLEPGLNDNSSP